LKRRKHGRGVIERAVGVSGVAECRGGLMIKVEAISSLRHIATLHESATDTPWATGPLEG
jgi:hypothetical protein